MRQKNHFPCMHRLPHHPSSNCVNTPPLLAHPFSQQTSQGAHGVCVVMGLLGLRCSPYFCSASVIIIKNVTACTCPPITSQLDWSVIACSMAQGEAEVAMQQPVKADDKRQRQEDRQRHRQTGGRHCCVQTEQKKLTHMQKGIAGCA
jgi:hypothetical protein